MKSIILSIICVLSYSIAMASNEITWPNYSSDEYWAECPYGDVVIVSKEEEKFLGKPVGISADCVILEKSTNMWKTTTFNPKTGEYEIRRYLPSLYNMYTMNGRLIIVDGKIKIEE